MNLHFSFKAAKSPDVEKEIQQHVQKLENRLKVFHPDLVHLHGTLDFAPQSGCNLSLNLRLPSGQLFAESGGVNAKAAIKSGFAELVSQLNKHKELLRSEHKWPRDKAETASAMAEVASPVTPSATANKKNGNAGRAVKSLDGEIKRKTADNITAATFNRENHNLLQADVRQYLAANLKRLERYVTRELRIRESAGDLEPALVTRDEVIDELVLSALSADERKNDGPIEPWIFRLTYQAIRNVAGGNRSGIDSNQVNVPLEESVGTQNVTGSDEAFLQFHQPGEMMHEEDVIADKRAGNPEELASSDETIDQLEASLTGTSSEQREAFVLFAIEGFSVAEIAQITGREAVEVKQHIVSARDHVMKKLPCGNSLKKKLMQYSNVA